MNEKTEKKTKNTAICHHKWSIIALTCTIGVIRVSQCSFNIG